MSRSHPWAVSDALWEQVKPLVPLAPSHAKRGRPRLSDRQAFDTMVLRARSGSSVGQCFMTILMALS